MTKNSLFAAASAAAALAAFPTAASAATVQVQGTTITVTGDATNETTTVADNGQFITVDGVATTATATNAFDLTLNAGAGNDTIVVDTAQLRILTLNAEDGEDTVTGSPDDDIISGGDGLDTLNGGGGDDRISGNDDDDTMNGDAGNDVMVWNPGDDDDVMDGGAGGGDDAELNGGNGPESFAATPNAGRVRFERVSPAPFFLDVGPDTERLVLNANGGDDTMVSDPATPTAMLLNGGAGIDGLQSGAGADLLNGGDDNDSLAGGPGIDRLVGDRGGDTMLGGAHDDTLAWNNGDGSDTMEGEDGLDAVEVNGAAAAGDAFEIAPDGQRVKFDRTNLVPFTLDIATSEVLHLNALGGDDALDVKPGVLMAINARGGAGNDRLSGGGANDLLDGQDGDDDLLAREGVGDLVRGGAGTDSAQVDKHDIHVDVEDVDRRKQAVHVIGGKGRIKHDRRRRPYTHVTLKCDDDCEGRLTLLTAKRYRVHGIKVRLVLGSAKYHLVAGEEKQIKVSLTKSVKRLARNGRLAALAQGEKLVLTR